MITAGRPKLEIPIPLYVWMLVEAQRETAWGERRTVRGACDKLAEEFSSILGHSGVKAETLRRQYKVAEKMLRERHQGDDIKDFRRAVLADIKAQRERNGHSLSKSVRGLVLELMTRPTVEVGKPSAAEIEAERQKLAAMEAQHKALERHIVDLLAEYRRLGGTMI